MVEGEHNPRIPPWAERDRTADMAWIRENLPIFWPAAQIGYAMRGRGAIVVDTTVTTPEAGNPFAYFDLEQVIALRNLDALRMVSEYEPGSQFVAMLLKALNRVSTYHILVPRAALGSGRGWHVNGSV